MSHLYSSVVITTINTTTSHQPSTSISTSTATSTSTNYSRHTFIRHIISCIITLFILSLTQITYIHAQDCILTVPTEPTKIQGLARPWILSGPGCTQTSSTTQTFVQGAIIDLRSGKISIYDPLVVDAENINKPNGFIKPDQPLINNNNIIIAYWIQTHARTITLIDANNGAALREANCTSGLSSDSGLSRFGKFAHCNAYAFFVAANQQVAGGQLSPPLPGKGTDKLPCPTTRDYAFLGRNLHGTVMTTYLLNPETQQISQDTVANRKACEFTCVVIQSDSARMINDIMFSLGCALWIAPDLADKKGGQSAAALPLNELQAANARLTPGTMALIPANDSLATVGGEQNIDKLNLVRVGLNQPSVSKLSDASTWDYCMALATIPQPRLAADMDLLKKYTRQGDISEANSLYTLVVKRQIELYQQLGCTDVAPVPFKVVPSDWTPSSDSSLQDAIPIQPSMILPLRCQNMMIIDTKCSFLLCVIVVGGGLTLGFIFFVGLKIIQGYKNGGKSRTADATRTAIRV